MTIDDPCLSATDDAVRQEIGPNQITSILQILHYTRYAERNKNKPGLIDAHNVWFFVDNCLQTVQNQTYILKKGMDLNDLQLK